MKTRHVVYVQYHVTRRRFLLPIVAVGKKAISITYSECVFVALGTKHAMRMRYITLPSAACLGVPYFVTLSHKRHDFFEAKNYRS
jgi:hypothetical protein